MLYKSCNNLAQTISPLKIALIIIYFLLLIVAIFMIISFYICDNNTCKIFTDAEAEELPGTREHVIYLMNHVYRDGTWPLDYIGASIISAFTIWFIHDVISVKLFALVFIVSFITIYFVMAFFFHHYLRPIIEYNLDFIKNSCLPSDNQFKDITINPNYKNVLKNKIQDIEITE